MRAPRRAHMGRVLRLASSYDVHAGVVPLSAQQRRLISIGSDLAIMIWNVEVIGDKQCSLKPFQSVSVEVIGDNAVSVFAAA